MPSQWRVCQCVCVLTLPVSVSAQYAGVRTEYAGVCTIKYTGVCTVKYTGVCTVKYTGVCQGRAGMPVWRAVHAGVAVCVTDGEQRALVGLINRLCCRQVGLCH